MMMIGSVFVLGSAVTLGLASTAIFLAGFSLWLILRVQARKKERNGYLRRALVKLLYEGGPSQAGGLVAGSAGKLSAKEVDTTAARLLEMGEIQKGDAGFDLTDRGRRIYDEAALKSFDL